jgi:quercetin dioxygenase-like cupin family protein
MTPNTLKMSALSFLTGAALLSFVLPVSAVQDTNPSSEQLLSVAFEPRAIATMQGGDFHFAPGQTAPVHTHTAPAIGYIAKGQILYQVEGHRPVILSEGDAFYEPAGPRILRFDNASATEEAIFVDYSFQREDEPFIVFEAPLTEDIDRRTLPDVEMSGQVVSSVVVTETGLEAGGQAVLEGRGLIMAYVAEGVIELRMDGGDYQRYAAGDAIALGAGSGEITIANLSDDVRARVITMTGQ